MSERQYVCGMMRGRCWRESDIAEGNIARLKLAQPDLRKEHIGSLLPHKAASLAWSNWFTRPHASTSVSLACDSDKTSGRHKMSHHTILEHSDGSSSVRCTCKYGESCRICLSLQRVIPLLNDHRRRNQHKRSILAPRVDVKQEEISRVLH